ncbi:MAG: hypothetical protein H6626_11480 [Pseudobdellovibrionaceae bacterium]|nr:hypothetical protein [Bdellovibrionales bacterium]USN46816.1 MAG: hypothetical protein H6626_11480 [Pseudobdellovibrionaceae bacterium]
MRNKLIKLELVISMGVSISACGIKGDPLPPEKPAEISQGRPTYERSTREDTGVQKNKVKKKRANDE